MSEVDSLPPKETLEQRRQRLYDFKQDVSTKISDICRFIGLGLVAVFYTIQTGSSGDHYALHQSFLLYFVGISGVVAILLDYVHYVNNYRAVDDALNRPSLRYEKDGRPYRMGVLAFKWKQRVAFAGAVALILLVAFASTSTFAPSA